MTKLTERGKSFARSKPRKILISFLDTSTDIRISKHNSLHYG